MQLCLLCRRWFKTVREIFQNFTFISSHWFLLALVVGWTAESVDHVSFQIGATQLDSFPSVHSVWFLSIFLLLVLVEVREEFCCFPLLQRQGAGLVVDRGGKGQGITWVLYWGWLCLYVAVTFFKSSVCLDSCRGQTCVSSARNRLVKPTEKSFFDWKKKNVEWIFHLDGLLKYPCFIRHLF